MSRSRRVKARSRSGSIPVKPRHSSDSAASEPPRSGGNPAEASVFHFERIDAAILALILGFALLLIARTGFVNGRGLWPIPDAVEYAAIAVNLDRGLGPVLHFGGVSYPCRYTIGYPLILAAAYPLLGHKAEQLCLVTALLGLAAIAGLYILTLGAFDRPSAILAALLLATSPYFLVLSTCVLSDVPALAVVVLAALAFMYAEGKESLVASALCGLLAGLAVIIRPTNGAILVGMLAAVLLVRPRRLQFARVMAFAVGFGAFPGLQAWLNLRYLGSIGASGYGFWLPAIYGSIFKSFDLRFLFVPTYGTYRYGNLVSYALPMLGLDGILGQLNFGTELGTLQHAHYAFYPFPVAVFAAMGVYFAVGRKDRNAATMRAVYLGLGFLASLSLIYLFYAWTDPRFILPASFIVFAAAGYGLASANRRLAAGWGAIAVISLDVVLAAAIVVQTVSGAPVAPPRQPKLVDEVLAIRPQLANAVVVSDISLQWLELFARGEQTEFVGLNSLFAFKVQERQVTEYHLSLLYDKKSAGWSGPMPPILLPGGKLDPAEVRRLAEEDKKGRPVYLLLLVPATYEWSRELKRETAEIDPYFSLETIGHYSEVGLYRLKPR